MQNEGIFYGWWIVLAISVIHFWGAGIFVYGFTAFFNPLVEEFQWSYVATSFAVSFRSFESGIAAPIVGFLTDKLGPKRLMLIGAVITGIGCMLLSRISSLWNFYAAFLFLSIGISMILPVPGQTAVVNWFSRKRSTAMGIILAALGGSGALIPLISWLIDHYGWRSTFVIAGVGMWVIGIPFSLMVRHRPEQYGYLPDERGRPGEGGEIQERQRQDRLNGEDSGFGVRQATKTQAFWILALVATVAGAANNAVLVHVMPCLISVQVSTETASFIAASLAASSIVGRLGFGWLGDRVDKKCLLGFALLLEALGLIIFAYTRSLAYGIAFTVLFGFGVGGASILRVTIQGDFFGRKAFGSIQGVMHGIHTVGTILSPIFVGWIYDVQASYQFAWLVLGVTVFLSIPLVLVIKHPKEQMLPF